MNTTDYNDFVLQFKAQAQELENALSNKTASTKEIEQISLNLTKLRTGLTEAVSAGILPTYDHQLCQQRLTALEESLSKARAASKPKSKFSFKSTANTRPASTVKPAPTPAPTHSPNVPEVSTTNSTAEISLTGHTHKYLTLQDLVGNTSSEAQSLVLTIKGLSECFIDLTSAATPTSINAIHVHDLKRTVLYAGNVQGSILLHGCLGCTIIVSSHQFRMHTSDSTNVYLKIASNPVIEKCTNIGFGPFPSTNETTDSISYIVQDFDWMGESRSPNWHAIGRAGFQLLSSVPEGELDNVLSAVLPQGSTS